MLRIVFLLKLRPLIKTTAADLHRCGLCCSLHVSSSATGQHSQCNIIATLIVVRTCHEGAIFSTNLVHRCAELNSMIYNDYPGRAKSWTEREPNSAVPQCVCHPFLAYNEYVKRTSSVVLICVCGSCCLFASLSARFYFTFYILGRGVGKNLFEIAWAVYIYHLEAFGSTIMS